MFKVGDKVLCVDSNSHLRIKKGSVYTVVRVNPFEDTIALEGNDVRYYANRFVIYSSLFQEWENKVSQ